MRKLLLLSAALIFSLQAHADDKVKLQMDWIASGEHAAYYGGWAKGIFKKHGIDITIVRGYGSGDTVSKVGAGAADFGVADMSPLLEARARKDVPVQAIESIYTYSPHSLFVLKSSGITSFKGLEGKKIGTTPGNSHMLFFPDVAKNSGTDPSKLIWVNMDAAAMSTQLLAKNIDAAPFYSIHWYEQNKVAKKYGEEIRVLPFVKAGFTIYAVVLFAPDKTIESNMPLVNRMRDAVKESFEWAQKNPEEACRLHITKVPEVDMDDCVNSLKAALKFVFNPYEEKNGFGNFTDVRLKQTWEAVAKAQDLPLDWDPSKAVMKNIIVKEKK